jgi:hypothetical protein
MDKNDEGEQYQLTPSNSKSFWRPEQMVTLEEIRPASNDSNDGTDGNVDDSEREIQSLNTEQALEKLNAMLQCNSNSDEFQQSDYSQSSSSSSSSKGSDWGASNTRGYPKNFNPATAHFTEDELKPTPITRKAQKKLVKAEEKDDKYWQKRTKNNAAAKRSREARRSRENQIAMRAGYLESDNAALKEELLSVKEELQTLKEKMLVVQMHNAAAGKRLHQ